MNGCSSENVVQASTTHPLSPTSTFATHYKMNHPKRGMALIFDHESFLDPGLIIREGTHLDCKELEKTWNKFGFDVTVYHDLMYAEIAKTLKTGNNYHMNLKIRFSYDKFKPFD